MPSEKSPVFRKPVIPWYQSKTAYSIMVVFMLVVFLVGMTGISVSREIEEYNGYLWIPAVLVILSLCLMIINIIRLIRRYTSKA